MLATALPCLKFVPFVPPPPPPALERIGTDAVWIRRRRTRPEAAPQAAASH